MAVPRLNELPDGYKAGLRQDDLSDDREEPGEAFFYVLYHWERPRFRLHYRWVRKAKVLVGPHRNVSIEAAIRGRWLAQIAKKNLT